MSTPEAQARPAPLPLRVALAPLVWLERTRGRKRLGLLMLYGLIAAVVALFVWRATSLNGLPDVGDPFDVEAFISQDVPDDENAFTLYRQAIAKMTPTVETQNYNAMWGVVRGGWSKAGDGLKDWVGANREALDLFRRGSERTRAQIRPLRTAVPDGKDMKALTGVQDLIYLALLEGSRLHERGDLAGAWGWYGAALRASRHLGMRSSHQVNGMVLFQLASERVTPWVNDDRADARLLRRALADVQAFQALTPPASEGVKADYVGFRNALRDPSGLLGMGGGDHDQILAGQQPRLFRAFLFLKREPERSLRLARLIFANRLAHCDEPPEARPKRVDEVRLGNTGYPIEVYDDPESPLGPEALAGWALSTFYAEHFLPNYRFTIDIRDGERASWDTLIMTLAERCYEREHGAPAPSAEALVGPYLKALPGRYAQPADDEAKRP